MLARMIPPNATQSGYHWVQRYPLAEPIPLHWNALWHRNGAEGWGKWSEPDREGQWKYIEPCPMPAAFTTS